MIGYDHKPATNVAVSLLLSLGLLLGAGAQARAENISDMASAPVFSVTLVIDGSENVHPTRVRTVAAFLKERELSVSGNDYVSAPLDAALFDGMHIEYRPAVAVTVFVDDNQRELHSSAATIEALLASQSMRLGSNDEITPSLDSRLLPNAVVRITRVKVWTEKQFTPIPQPVRHRDLAWLARGSSHVIDPGEPGRRETTVRFVQRNGETPQSTALASRVLRKPRAKVVAVGVAQADFVDLARYGITEAVHLAGDAVKMIATAYVAGCFGCSGITALGLPAGHGIVAVDPRFIPLGTKLYVPGYGRAVAGDTGGSIKGRRIDLGFNSLAAALAFGRRQITVYVLR